jgi:hypothetical protein
VTALPLPGTRSGMRPTATVPARRGSALADAVVPHQATLAITLLWQRLQEASW